MKQEIKFNKKKHIWSGIVSCTMAALECILFLLLVMVSFIKKGNAGSWIGMSCVILIFMAIWGVYIGINGVSQSKRVYKTSSWIGIVLNSAIIVGMILLFFSGL